MKKSQSYCATISASLLVFTAFCSSVNATVLPLEMRLGGLAYYDPNLDITWAADANINGEANWVDQTAWAAGLNISGVTGWRLASMDVNDDLTVVNCAIVSATDCKDNEMGYLYYQEGITALTPGPFINIVSGLASNGSTAVYWSSSENFVGSNSARTFEFGAGGNGSGNINLANYIYGWAVHSGDVAVIPVPAAIWLFGSGVLALFAVARRKIHT